MIMQNATYSGFKLHSSKFGRLTGKGVAQFSSFLNYIYDTKHHEIQTVVNKLDETSYN